MLKKILVSLLIFSAVLLNPIIANAAADPVAPTVILANKTDTAFAYKFFSDECPSDYQNLDPYTTITHTVTKCDLHARFSLIRKSNNKEYFYYPERYFDFSQVVSVDLTLHQVWGEDQIISDIHCVDVGHGIYNCIPAPPPISQVSITNNTGEAVRYYFQSLNGSTGYDLQPYTSGTYGTNRADTAASIIVYNLRSFTQGYCNKQQYYNAQKMKSIIIEPNYVCDVTCDDGSPSSCETAPPIWK